MPGLKFGGIGLLLLALAACAEPDRITAQAPDASAQQAQQFPQDYTTEVRSATVYQGTNMALTARGDVRVISLQGQLFLLDDEGQGTALIGPEYDAREPQLGPDQRTIVFHGYRGGNWDVWQTDIDGMEPVQITNDGYDDREPQLTPDGTGVVFSSDRVGSYDIWRLNFADGDLQRMTATVGDASSPSLHPQGGLAYALQVARASTLMLAEGGELIRHPGTISGVQWSPDGNSISYQLHGLGGTQMRLFDVTSGDDRLLSHVGADVFPFRASWLDAQTLAYVADGVLKRKTLGEPAAEWPFSVTLALTRHNYERRHRDYDPERVRQALGLTYPVISNDGAHILFSALGDIWQWRPDQDELLQLTDSPAAEFGLALDAQGTQLAYVSDQGGRLDVWIKNLTDGTLRSLGLRANLIANLSWSPDGESLAYFVDVPTNPLGGQLRVLNLASGETQNVLAPMPAQPISWSADGQNIAVTRLNRYSKRYREGVYELVVANIETKQETTILPRRHHSISHAVLTADGGMTYLQGGLLHRLELSPEFQRTEYAGQVTDELTDFPAWSANGEHLVYLSGNKLKRLARASGISDDITPSLPWREQAPVGQRIVRAGRLYTGTSDDYLLNQDIVLEGARIVAISPADPTVVPDLDASASTVVPGLFEMHAHMGETSEVQGRIWLSHGITSVRDPGSNPYTAKERQEAWDSQRRVGPRTHITGYLTDGNRVYYAMAEGVVSDAHLDHVLQRAHWLELDFIKTYVRLPDHQQRRVIDFAHRHGMSVSSHEIYPAIAYGSDHVEHIGGTSRRGYQPKVSRLGYSYQDVIEMLSVGNMGITATAVLPGSMVIVQEEPDWFETRQFDHFYGPATRRQYEGMVNLFGLGADATAQANGGLLRALTERDALLVTGTDAPFVPYGAGLHAEFRLYARAGVSARDILRQATLKSAQAAGVADDLGTLEVGKLADMVVVDGDPLNEIRDLDRVRVTVKHGVIYPLEELLKTP